MWAKFLNDRFNWAICTMPLFLGLLMAWIFYQQIPTRLNVGLIDLDKSHLSQEIISSLNANSALNIKYFYSSLREAKPAIASKEIYAVVVLPHNLERHVKLGIKTPLALYYNAEYVLVGKTLANAFLQTLVTIDVKQDVARNLSIHHDLLMAKALAFPLHVNLHPLYNEHNNYSQFLLTAILPCMWQILVALGMLNFLQHCVHIREVLAALGLNTLIFSLWGTLLVAYLKPYNAHWGVLALAVVLLVLGVSSVVMFFHALIKDPVRIASFVAAYTAPSLAFVGVTYPVTNMSTLGEFWSSLLPISYFVKCYIALAHYQEGLRLALNSLSQMLFFLLFLPLSLLILQKKGVA